MVTRLERGRGLQCQSKSAEGTFWGILENSAALVQCDVGRRWAVAEHGLLWPAVAVRCLCADLFSYFCLKFEVWGLQLIESIWMFRAVKRFPFKLGAAIFTPGNLWSVV